MSLLDDVVDDLVGGRPAPAADPSHETREPPRSPAPATRSPSQGIQLNIVVEAVDADGRSARASHQVAVPNGTIKMMEVIADGDGSLLEQLAKSTLTAAVKSVTPRPGAGGGSAVLEEAVSKPGPIGGRDPQKRDPLADMLRLDLIEHQDSLDRGGAGPQPQRPQQPMGGPHTTGPRPGPGHPTRR